MNRIFKKSAFAFSLLFIAGLSMIVNGEVDYGMTLLIVAVIAAIPMLMVCAVKAWDFLSSFEWGDG